MGIGNSNTWNNNLLFDNVNNEYFYYGNNGLSEYKSILYDLSYNILNIFAIPIENATTENTYLEEGTPITSTSGIEYRSYSENNDSINLHPYFSNEIMTTNIEDETIISSITLGFLQDLNYDVCYNSIYVAKPEYFEGGYDISRISIYPSNYTDGKKYWSLVTYLNEIKKIFYETKPIYYSSDKNYTSFSFDISTNSIYKIYLKELNILPHLNEEIVSFSFGINGPHKFFLDLSGYGDWSYLGNDESLYLSLIHI